MEKIVYESEFFSVKDTLFCGQVFRFRVNPVLSRARGAESYDVFSADKRCLAYNDGEKAVIECEEKDADYFYNYFDLRRDYSAIFKAAESFGGIIKTSAERGKGIRILNQERPDVIISSGAAPAIPFFWIGKMMGAKTIYIEVFDRIDKSTISG